MAEWKKSKLIGKRAYIPDENGRYFGDWGTIVAYDGEYYHIAFADDKNNVLIFKRDEIRIPRRQL